MKTLLRGAELAIRKLQDHLLFSAVVSSGVHRKRQKNEMISFFHFEDNKCIWVLNTLSRRHRILQYFDTIHVTSFQFSASLWTSIDSVSIHKHVKKEPGQYPAILTEQAWPITHMYKQKHRWYGPGISYWSVSAALPGKDQICTHTWRTWPKFSDFADLPPHLKGAKIRRRRLTFLNSLSRSARTYLSFWGKGS